MNNPISPEQALEIAKEVDATFTKYQFVGLPELGEGEVYVFEPEEFRQALNLAITKYFGEPVAWQRYHELKGWIDVEAADIEHYQSKGQPIRSLYARKE